MRWIWSYRTPTIPRTRQGRHAPLWASPDAKEFLFDEITREPPAIAILLNWKEREIVIAEYRRAASNTRGRSR